MIRLRPPARNFAVLARSLHAFLLVVLFCALSSSGQAQRAKQGTRRELTNSTRRDRLIQIGKSQVLIPDVVVLNEQGKRVRLYTDLIKDKVVLFNFFYTTCSYVCQMQGSDLSEVQARLGKRLGKEVFLISISMDPANDTPERLRHWARALGVKPGWTLVTSTSAEIKTMLKTFTGNDPGPRERHYSVVFIGDDKSGKWISADGLAGPEGLIELINSL